MGRLIFFIAVIAGGLAVFPLAYEARGNSCTALESLAVRQQAPGGLEGVVARGVAEASNGEIARTRAGQIYPSLPPWLGCYAAYWSTLVRGVPR
jgi:hypothetical protein